MVPGCHRKFVCACLCPVIFLFDRKMNFSVRVRDLAVSTKVQQKQKLTEGGQKRKIVLTLLVKTSTNGYSLLFCFWHPKLQVLLITHMVCTTKVKCSISFLLGIMIAPCPNQNYQRIPYKFIYNLYCIVLNVVFHILMILQSFTSTEPTQKGLLTSFTLQFVCSYFNLLTSNFSFQPCSSECVSALIFQLNWRLILYEFKAGLY